MNQSEKADLAEKDYIAGMKYREIAEKYNVSEDTVKSWKKRKNWVRESKSSKTGNSRNSENRVHTKIEKGCTQKSKVQQYPENEEIEGYDLDEKHMMFCVYYVKSYNATKSYQKVYGCDYYSAAVSANRLLKNPNIQKCIQEMQSQMIEKTMIREEDVLQRYIDIAMSDTNEFVEIVDGEVRIKENLDGTVVKGIKEGKFGIEVQLYDRMKALDKVMEQIQKNKARNQEVDGGGIIEITKRVELEDPEDEQCNMDSTT